MKGQDANRGGLVGGGRECGGNGQGRGLGQRREARE